MALTSKPLLALVLLVQLGGCATARTLNANQPGAPVVYAGSRLDYYAMHGGCCEMDRFGALAPSHPGLDLPASTLLDTLLLPLSLLTALGVGYGVEGGL